MTLAVYRKYRPVTFKEMLGQENLVKILQNAAIQNKISHAYLFAGPRGTGKTTLARLIAKVANCETRLKDERFRGFGEPCNNCRICVEVDSGRALDVIEIDAASNRGIDEIRDLKESVRSAPTSYSHKIFIIDEAHQLTKEAFNALLKTLEEPPANVIFILATTELERIPATIASRAQIFRFRKIPLSQIKNKLAKVAAQENINLSPDALELISASAEGSFRDAESILDQFLSFGYDKVNVEDVEKMFGKISLSKVVNFAEKLINGDLTKTLGDLSDFAKQGFSLTHFTKDLIAYLRRVLVLKLNPEMETAFREELTSDELEKIKDHAKLTKEAEHILLLKSLINAYGQMRYSQFPLIPLEIAIVESLKK